MFVICFLEILVASMTNLFYSFKHRNDEPITVDPTLRSNRRNKPLMTVIQYVVIITLMVVTSIPVHSINSTSESPKVFIGKQIPFLFTCGVIIPILFFIKNSDARRFYVREFWDVAPEWLQRCNPDRIVELEGRF